MLPNADTLYAALVAREDRFDGKFLVCVTSTGIYCRFGCPARTPLQRNVTFRSSVADCEAAGFRACKRCRPDAAPVPRMADPAGRGLRQMRLPRAGSSSVSAS